MKKSGKRGERMKYQESQEMYLETILLLKQNNACVRSIDIATQLNYSRPSVSRAVNLLQQNGYIAIDKNGEIHFTAEGKQKATEIYERHGIITQVLIKLGADETVAEENACRIEHVISKELMNTLKRFLETTEND
jgi:Mn-dependent DtxR family transcriptional regulator